MSDLANPSKFKISIFNWILCGGFVGFLIYILIAAWPVSDEKAGELLANVLLAVLLPYFLSWIAWRVLKRSRPAANIVFFFALLLVLSSWIQDIDRRAQKNVAFDELKDKMAQRLSAVKSDPENADAQFKQIGNDFESVIAKAKNLSDSDDKEYYSIVQSIYADMKAENLLWEESLNKVEEAGLLDFSNISAQEDLKKKMDLAEDYLKATQRFSQFINNVESYCKEKLSPLGNNKHVDGFMNGIRENADTYSQLTDKKLDLAVMYQKILILLDQKWGQWRYDPQVGVLFQNGTDLQEYNSLLSQLQDTEDHLNKLSSNLVNSKIEQYAK